AQIRDSANLKLECPGPRDRHNSLLPARLDEYGSGMTIERGRDFPGLSHGYVPGRRCGTWIAECKLAQDHDLLLTGPRNVVGGAYQNYLRALRGTLGSRELLEEQIVGLAKHHSRGLLSGLEASLVREQDGNSRILLSPGLGSRNG